MPRWVVILALFLVCSAVIFRFVRRVRSEIRRSPELDERLSPLMVLGIVMIVSLLTNALGLVSFVEIAAWSRAQPPDVMHMLKDQAALVFGTAGLSALIPATLLRSEVYTHPDPRLGSLRGVVSMLESLFLRGIPRLRSGLWRTRTQCYSCPARRGAFPCVGGDSYLSLLRWAPSGWSLT